MSMATKIDYYEVLGVTRTASQQEIASAYRSLAIKYHPDRNPGDEEAVQRFKECSEAFEVLHDTDKRSRYDRYGHAGVNGPGGGAGFTDVGDIFAAFGDIFGDLFGGGRGGRRVRRGGDVHCELTLDLLSAARGVDKTLEFQRHVRCTTCDGNGCAPGSKPRACTYCGGRGQVIRSSGIIRVQTTCPACQGSGAEITDPCQDCRGSGFTKETVHREVHIPAGIDDGMQVRLTGEGEPSPDGGPPGDCYCHIHVSEHPLFAREGQHLVCRLPITYSQAALGATIQVPTLSGPEDLQVHPGTQPGQVYTLRGRGMRDPHGRGTGDLLVQCNIEVPKKLDAAEEKLLRELAELEHANVSPHRKSFLEKLKEYFTADE